MDPNREHLKKIVDKHHRDFSFWAWVLRVITLCLAFGSIIYYLANNNGPHDPYEESSLIEEVFFGDEDDEENARAEDKGSQNNEGTDKEKRPDMQIPVFRSGE